MHFAATLQTFAAIFPAELPDKTMVACIVLVSRHRRRSAVFAGAAAAFALHVTLAVSAGSLLTRLPRQPVELATALVFVVGALTLWRSSRRAPVAPRPEGAVGAAEEGPSEAGELGAGSTLLEAPARRSTAWTAVLTSFGVIAVAEFGDLTQLATAGLAVRTGAPLEVAIGSLAALCSVAALAILAGRTLLRWLRVETLQRAAAVMFGVLALVTVLSALGL